MLLSLKNQIYRASYSGLQFKPERFTCHLYLNCQMLKRLAVCLYQFYYSIDNLNETERLRNAAPKLLPRPPNLT